MMTSTQIRQHNLDLHKTAPVFSVTTQLCLALAVISMGSGCRGLQQPDSSATALPTRTTTADSTSDPFLWLEDVTGEKSLAWVRQQNARTTNELEALPDFESTRTRLLAILDSRERIPYVSKNGQFYYNFWQDDKNPRGLWRRTTLDEYRKTNPDWETVLDLDQLAATENENWVWKGANVLRPDYDRCLISLSRGGADAAVLRELMVEGGGKFSELVITTIRLEC